MKELLALCISLLITCISQAQNYADTSKIFISGKLKNPKQNYFDFAKTGFFKDNISSVTLKKDGSFSYTFYIEGKQQDIYLYHNDDAITFTLKENDSLQLFWDDNDFKNTFKILSNDTLRSKLLNVQWQQYLRFHDVYSGLKTKLNNERENMSISEKFLLVNTAYNKELSFLKEIVHKLHPASWSTLVTNIFYKYTNILLDFGILSKYELEALDTIADSNLVKVLPYLNHKTLSEPDVWTSVEYRNFLYNYLRFLNVFDSFIGEFEFNPTLQDYYMAKATLQSPAIQNWFIATIIITDFSRYAFKKVENVYDIFLQELKDESLKKILVDTYAASSTLKPGKLAPSFELKDENGKTISLADFRGKVVYIDFWSVDCGPCIYDIEKYSHKLHEAYKGKDIVFVSICVDENEKQWKDALEKYKMKGSINLITSDGKIMLFAKHIISRQFPVIS